MVGFEDYIKSTEYDGTLRTLYPKECGNCLQTFWVPKHRFDRSRFCSVICSAEGRQTRISDVCVVCDKAFKRLKSKVSKSGLYFCGRECKDYAQSIDSGKLLHIPHYKTGKGTYRARALGFYGEVCSLCGYNKHVTMLDVDHIDSDRNNNHISNLQVLCVWCHALKTRHVLVHTWNGALV